VSVPFKLMTSRILALSVRVFLRVVGCLVDCRSVGGRCVWWSWSRRVFGYISLVGPAVLLWRPLHAQ